MGKKNTNRERSSISLGISLSILSATLFLFGFFIIIYVLISQQAQNNRNQSRLYGETVVDNLTQAIELSEKTEQWLQAYVVAVGTNPGLLQVAIVDKTGLMIAHSDPKKKGIQAPDEAFLQRDFQTVDSFILDTSSATPFMRFVAPVSIFSQDGTEEGLVFADVELSPKIEAFTAGETMGFLLGLLAIFAFTIGTLYLFLNQRVIKIVRRLTRGARYIAAGNFSKRIAVNRNDELGHLAESFNIMARTLGETTISRNFYDNILRSMGDSLIVFDANLNIITVNQASLTLLGYEEHELIGKNVSDIFGKEERKPLDDTCTLKITEVDSNAIFYTAKDGRKIPVLESRAFIESGLEDRGVLVCIAKDITQRIQDEQDIRQINVNLVETNKRLQQTQEQLIQSGKLASLGEMAAGIAHELNQPLHIIGMSAEMGSNYLQMEKYGKIEAKLEKIGQQVQRATAIIDHLRTFGREAGGIEQDVHDINHIIEDTFILFNEQFRVHGIKVEKQLGEGLPLVTCNPIQLEQVLSNLLVNAKDAMEGSAQKTIYLTSRVLEKSVVIEVQDTGTGMDRAVQGKIFDPFYTTKKVGRGTGLGLSISYGIINDHGGSLEVESAPGKGTLFRIQLPAAKENK